MAAYFLDFADCDVQACDEAFDTIDQARDVAFDISAETNRRINITEVFGISSNVVESVLA